jgi:hypothetical protein
MEFHSALHDKTFMIMVSLAVQGSYKHSVQMQEQREWRVVCGQSDTKNGK